MCLSVKNFRLTNIFFSIVLLLLCSPFCFSQNTKADSLFAHRNFSEAKSEWLAMEQTPEVRKWVALCDSCQQLEQNALHYLLRLKELQQSSTDVTQLQYGTVLSVALAHFEILNNICPNELYQNRANRLNEIIADIPMEIKFTTVEWSRDEAGLLEKGVMPGVEVWACHNTAAARKADLSRGDFEDLVKDEDGFELLGVTDGAGILELNLDRGKTPIAFFFKSPKNLGKAKVHRVLRTELLRTAVDNFNKRQFRVKIYNK